MNYPKIRAGQLRFPIDIVSPSKVQDVAGGMVPAAGQVFASVWANIEAVDSRDIYSALQIAAQVTHKVTMHWIPGVLANMDVVFSNGSPAVTRVFKIIAVVNPDERPHVLYLMCLERDDSAYTVAGQ